jgi:hypothetical protein
MPMTDGLKAWSSRRRKVSIVALAALIPAVAVFTLYTRATAQSASGVLIQFTHQKHLAAGIPCLFCHPGAINGAVAGIPSAQKCAGCHNNIQVSSRKGQATVNQLLAAFNAGQPLLWPRAVNLPDFVHFDHYPHIAAGKNCETCHGNVSAMTMATEVYRIDMGFCLNSCHRSQDPVKRERLMSCATCHQ